MGLSWGIGGGLAGLILMLFQKYGRLEQAFLVFAVAAVMSSGMCFLLTDSAKLARGDGFELAGLQGTQPRSHRGSIRIKTAC